MAKTNPKTDPLPKPKTKLGERLEELMNERDWTEEYLGALLGMQGANINRYKKGTREPSVANLMLMADLFEVSLDYLMGRSDDRVPVIPEPEKSVDEEIEELLSDIDTFALHRIGDYTKDLPHQAKKQIKEIIIAYLKTFPKED